MKKNNDKMHRVRTPVNPTNRIISKEHGIRQGVFLYSLFSNANILNLSVISKTSKDLIATAEVKYV